MRCAVVIPEAETGDFWTRRCLDPTRVVVVVTELVVERNIYEKNI